MEPLERACFLFFMLVGFAVVCALLKHGWDWWVQSCRLDAERQAREEYRETDEEDTVDLDETATGLRWREDRERP